MLRKYGAAFEQYGSAQPCNVVSQFYKKNNMNPKNIFKEIFLPEKVFLPFNLVGICRVKSKLF